MQEQKATPRLEDGNTRIANELLEAIGRTPLSDYEHRIINCIMRYTYGWSRKYYDITMPEFVEFTNMTKPNVCHILNRLYKRHIVAYLNNENTKKYYIITDYSTWKSLSKQTMLSKQTTNVVCTGNKPSPLNNPLLIKYKSNMQSAVKKQTDPAIKTLIDHYYKHLQTVFKDENIVCGFGQLGKSLQVLRKQNQSEEDIKKAIDNYFKSTDKFIVSSGYKPGVFFGMYNVCKTSVPGAAAQKPIDDGLDARTRTLIRLAKEKKEREANNGLATT